MRRVVLVEGRRVSYWEAVVLGLVQGLTEFLPVSSSGHLALGHLLVGDASRTSKGFDILVHGATLIVIVGAFWRVLLDMLLRDRRLLAFLALSMVPTFYVGLWWRHEMDVLGHSPWTLAAMFTVTGAFLWSVGKFAPPEDAPETVTDLSRFGWANAFLVGLAQALAIAPGVSRSGLTISAGRLCGVAPQQAVAFSFVLGAPTILAALIVEAHPISELAASNPGPLAAGFLAALGSGYLAMGLLRRMAERGSLQRFAPYCFVVAALCLVVAAVR